MSSCPIGFYESANLTPLRLSVDEDGDTHAVFNLSDPKQWICKRYEFTPNLCAPLHTEIKTINRVRMCMSVADRVTRPFTTLVPIDEAGEEWPLSSVVLYGVASPWAAFEHLGFTILLPIN